MATLTIRNLPEEVHDALRRQAAEHRRSMEAEAREVLQAAIRPRPSEVQRRQALARLQAMGAEIKAKRGEPEGWSGTDEFLAEKHLEAIWENGWVTNAERRHWLDRLGRFEVWPEELEALVAERVNAHQ
jgi:plasmid stability protein